MSATTNFEKVQSNVFNPGDRVLANFPVGGFPFQARILVLYIVESHVSDVNDMISTPNRSKSTYLCQFESIC